ncbi:NADH dehydrogenase [ubiquinone] flavoprotein 2, mitochondrial isoform X2 [Manduca sexta]|uniref:NADH dehydrogenase [ubiquinone] flavoprotein 2, mitochondrial isoform X2 n=1 Tax=Manduca sexta TaxID=7130 RepID=UPI00188DE6BB|nr:NADH dehydrogenase [ubiquinone] flavoprotein 2, mitochondrial isoform X2 [Manduca sexta]
MTMKVWSELSVHRDSVDNNANTPFEFTEANMMRIAALIQNYPVGAQKAAVGACLDIVQRQMGWIPISAMHKVAEILSMPRMRVYEWVSFYTMNKRHFRGQFHIQVCTTTPCMLRGAEEILDAVEQSCCCCAGGLSADGMFGVDIVECQGACVNAPMFVVNDDYYKWKICCGATVWFDESVRPTAAAGARPAGRSHGNAYLSRFRKIAYPLLYQILNCEYC